MRCCTFFILLLLSIQFYSQNKLSDTLHSPKKSAIFSACIPGSGQVYNNFYRPETLKNKLWWKLPIIYGGLGASLFFIVDNNNQFNSFKNERLYRKETGLINLYPELSSTQLKIIQEDYRRWRDLSVISLLGIYLLQLVDANVEGHLIHFDNSDDLSIKLIPQFKIDNYNSSAQFNIIIRF